jgi:ABC-type iron transport system FetAB permease component
MDISILLLVVMVVCVGAAIVCDREGKRRGKKALRWVSIALIAVSVIAAVFKLVLDMGYSPF